MNDSTDHQEQHFSATDTVRDIVIGMSDGLTVPFALAAGISTAVAATNLVVTAGLAEIAAGSIAMGLGGYLAARTDFEHYYTERRREQREIKEVPQIEKQEVADILTEYGLEAAQAGQVAEGMAAKPAKWVDFMMRFELGLEEPNPRRAGVSALTIALSYIVGGLIPLSPYMLAANVTTGLQVSVLVTLIALFVFGLVKGRFTGLKPLRSGLQTMLVGGLAAGVAFLVARLFS